MSNRLGHHHLFSLLALWLATATLFTATAAADSVTLSTTRDTTLISNLQSRNLGAEAFTAIWSTSASRYTIIKFDDLTGSVPAGSTINSATAKVTIGAFSLATAEAIELWRIGTDWSEGTGFSAGTDSNGASWGFAKREGADGIPVGAPGDSDSPIPWTTGGGGDYFGTGGVKGVDPFDTLTAASTLGTGTVLSFDATAIVQAWVDGDFPDHGILLTGPVSGTQIAFYSQEHSSGPAPELEIDFTPPITVDSTADNLTAGDGNCTLREAIMNANSDSDTTSGDCDAGTGADTIFVPAGTYTLALAGTNEDANATGDLDITDTDATILQGAGARTTIIDADDIDRVIHLNLGADMTIEGVTLRNGMTTTGGTSREGGGIQIEANATLVLNDSRVTDNHTPVGNGNIDGGGINTSSNTGNVTINRSLIDGNSAADAGGGIDFVCATSTLTINHSTIRGNTAARGAGLDTIFAEGTVNLNHVTITGNTSTGSSGGFQGGGILANTPGNDTVNIQNSIITGNSPQDCFGPNDVSLGHNVLGSNGSNGGCPSGGTGDVIPAGAPSTVISASLADNGGPTDTHALATGSPALDLIASGTSGCGTTNTEDQRGTVRPQGANCDAGAYEALPVPGFSKVFSPDVIASGGNSTLTFTIDNSGSGTGLTALAFTDSLPAGVLVATPNGAVDNCSGTLTATAGSGSITYSGGSIGASSTCTIDVDVTSSTPGSHVNTSSTLSSSAGTSAAATDTLTVIGPPGFAKAFSPSTIAPGGVSTLTFTIDNSANLAGVTGLAFTDSLPAGVIVASPNGAVDNCSGSLTANASSGSITYSGGSVGASSTCTVVVDVTSSTPGVYVNTSSTLTSSAGTSAAASDSLTVLAPPGFAKTFSPDTIASGGTSTLTFTVDNSANATGLTGLAFTDNLPAGVTIATPNGAVDNCSGTLTATAGSGSITYSGGSVSASSTCTIDVDITSSTSGSHVNTSSTLSSSAGTSVAATDTLTVLAAPGFAKAFSPDSISSGGTSTLTFTIDNSAGASTVGNLAFTDNLPAGVIIATPNGAVDNCSGSLTATAGSGSITYSGGSVAASSTCTIDVDVTSSTAGSHVNTSGDLTSDGGNSGTAMATLTVLATDGDFEWAIRAGSTTTTSGGDNGSRVVVDDAGNVYTMGNFRGTVDFDPGPGTFNLTSAGNVDAFVLKLDSAGNFVFALQFGSSQSDSVNALALDSSGNMYITGSFRGTVDFDPGAGTSNLTSSGGADIFVAKLDANANLIWARPAGGSDRDFGLGIGVDAAGNAYVTGEFRDTADFDPGPGTFNLTHGSSTGFALKLDSNGDFVWAGALKGSSSSDSSAPTDLALDAVSNVLITGSFENTVDFDPGAGTSNLSATGDDAFVLKLDSAGNFVWAVGLGDGGGGIATDAAGNVYNTGTFSGTVDFDPGAGTSNLTSAGLRDTYVLKLDNAGNLIWARQLGGTGEDWGNRIDVDPVGNVYTTGIFSSTNADFDPGPGTFNLASAGGAAFISKLDDTGDFISAKQIGPSTGIRALGLAVASAGDIHVSGDFENTADFDPGPGTFNLTSAGGRDIFVVKLTGLLPPAFSKEFAPDTIALGGTSTLTFTIDNSATFGATGLAFTDNLPAGVTVATPSGAVDNCSGSLTAGAGSSSITYSGGSVAASSSCTIVVDVTSSTLGAHVNTTSALASSAGTSGAASDTLTVISPPGFAKAFSPSTIASGATSTLTFTVDNTANAIGLTALAFTDNLPAGVTVATPSGAIDNCSGSLTAGAGTSSITYSGGSVGASSTCTVVVDVTSSTPGVYVNTSSTLTSSAGTSAAASDTLTVLAPPGFAKTFSPDTIASGGTSTLTFTVDNSANAIVLTGLAFTDNLPAGVTVETPNGLASTCGSAVIAAAGSGSISLTGGSVAAGSTCTIDVDVTSSTPGSHVNTSSTLSSSAGTSAAASDTLTVLAAPGFAKAFSPDSISSGDTSTLTFTIDNSGGASTVGNLAFTDNLPAGVIVATPNGAVDNCSGSLTANAGSGSITYSGGSVAASSSCTVVVDVTSSTAGAHVNTSGNLTSDAGNSGTAMATLTVLATDGDFEWAIRAGSTTTTSGGDIGGRVVVDDAGNVYATGAFRGTSDFDPGPGTFNLSSAGNADGFVLRLDSAGNFVSALQFGGGAFDAVNGLALDSSGNMHITGIFRGTVDFDPGAGTSNLTSSGGGDIFVVKLDANGNFVWARKAGSGNDRESGDSIAVDAAGNVYVTGDFQGTVDFDPGPGTFNLTHGGRTGFALKLDSNGDFVWAGALKGTSSSAISSPVELALDASSNVLITGSFENTVDFDPGAGTSNLSATGDDAFVLKLDSAGNFIWAVGMADGGSGIATDAAGSVYNTGTFSGTVDFDPGAGTNNLTSAGLRDIYVLKLDSAGNYIWARQLGGTGEDFGNRIDVDPVGNVYTAGSFRSTNADFDPGPGTFNLSSAGSDDVFISKLSGAGDFIFAKRIGSPTGDRAFGLAVGDDGDVHVSGDFQNTVDFDPGPGTFNLTSAGNRDIFVVKLSGLLPPAFSKEFAPDTIAPGGTSTLTFTIDNSATFSATGLALTDNLPAGVSVATPSGAVDNCSGTLTANAGSGSITYSGGSVAASSSCTIVVDVTSSTPGAHVNTSSTLTSSAGTSAAATDTLTVIGPPGFAKAFSPSTIAPGGVSTLTFTVDNSANPAGVTSLAFTDNLPAGVVVASPNGAVDNCSGSLTAAAGSGSITYSGGSLGASTTCTIDVDVTSSTPGVYVNTSSTLTSSAGTSAAASDTLTVLTPPGFAKVFSPDSIASGGTSTLTFTVDNTANAIGLTALAFTDNLPAGVTVETPNGLASTCGSAVIAAAGSGSISLTGGSVAAGSTCTIDVDVTSSTPGDHVNTSSTLASSAGTSAAASDTLTVLAAPGFAKEFSPDTIASGDTSTLTFTIDNSANATGLTGLAFTDNLPAGVVVESPNGLANTCGGTVTANAGSGSITLAGGSVAAGSSCSLDVDVTSSTPGDHVNTSGDLTSSAGNSGPASDTLTVLTAPGFAKAFSPDTIASGATSTLTFTIDNSANAIGLTGLAFTDNLPAGVTVATPNGAVDNCSGTLTANAGSGSLIYSGGSVAASSTCTVSVDVTSSTTGAHLNTSSTLASSAGTSAAATDTLTVLTPPGFAKAFSPDVIGSGGTSTLTFTIDSSANVAAVTSLAFTDNLPAGVVVATPNGAVDNCSGTLTAAAGSGSITYSGGSVAASATCTVSVDVTSSTPGIYANTSSTLSSDAGPSGAASDTLTVLDPPGFSKAFSPDTIISGATSTLTFTIDSSTNVTTVSSLAFNDTLPAGVVIATPNGAVDNCSGTLTANSGSGSITYSGGSVSASSSCTVSVDVTSSTPGDHVNVSGDLTSTAGNSGNASDTLTVLAALGFSKVFGPNTIAATDLSILTFSISNSNGIAIGNIDFTDNMPTEIEIANPPNILNSCPGTLVANPGSSTVTFSGGSLAAGSSCAINVDVTSTTLGAHLNTTGDLTSDAGNSGTADSTLFVVEPPAFSKQFGPDSIETGGLTTLAFLIDSTTNAGAVSGLFFSDTLPEALVIAATPNTTSTCGGIVNAPAGGTTITFSGASVAAGATCLVTVDVTTVDASAANVGVHVNTSGDLTSIAGNSGNAVASLSVFLPGFSTFLPGDNLSFEDLVLTDGNFDLSVPSWTTSGTAFSFNPTTAQFAGEATDGDNTAAANSGSLTQTTSTVLVEGAMYGMVVDVGDRLDLGYVGFTLELLADGVAFASVSSSVTPVDGEFAAASLTATASAAENGKALGLRLTSLGTQANFDYVRLLGSAAAPFVTITSPADGSSFLLGTNVAFAGTANDAEDGDLSASLTWTSSIDGAIGIGASFATTTLSGGVHTITASATDSDTNTGSADITVTVVANAPPVVTISSPNDGDTSTFGDGIPFSATAIDAEDGDITANLAWTSSIDGSIGSGGFFGTTSLSVGVHTITASVTDSGGAPGSDDVQITVAVNAVPVVSITSPNDGDTFTSGDNVSFAATANDAEDGDLSASLTWTSSIDGNIGAGASFASSSLSVGIHTITASVTDSHSDTGQDSLQITILALPIFSVQFGPDTIEAGATTVLAFVIQSSTNPVAIGNLDFTNVLPEKLEVASPANATNSCGGFVQANSGTGIIAFSGGSVGAGANCVITVEVTTDDATASSTGAHVNVTGDLTSDAGNSGTATDTLSAVLVGYDALLAGSNLSFEDLTLADGGFDINVPSWSVSNGLTFNPTTAQFTNEAPDGDNIGAVNAGSLTQTLGTTLASGSGYALVVEVGDRLDLAFGGYTLELLADGVAFASITTPVTPTAGDFSTVTLEAAASAAEDGKALGIRLASGGSQTNFDNVRIMFVATAPNAPPVVAITSPSDGDSFDVGDNVSFAATANDTEDGDISASLGWSSSIDGNIGAGASFSISTLSAGTHTITASVTDSGGAPGSDDISITVNTPPVVSITSPNDGDSFTAGDSVSFTGTANDAEDGDISASLDWTSSIDGNIGTGGSFSTSSLSAGTHTITASVTDAAGAPGSDDISITVLLALVANPGFEVDCPAADGGFTTTITSWTQTGTTGTFNPTTTQFPGEASEGSCTAFLNAGSLSQVAGQTLVADTTYTLEVDVGNRSDIGFTGFTIALYVDGIERAAASSPTPGNGVFTTATAEMTTSAADVGKSLEIRLTSNGPQTNFDNVRLTTSTPAVLPVFSKAFAPDLIEVGAITTLTFTVDNSTNGTPVTGLSFSDTLPAKLVVAPTPNPMTTCGGAVTAPAAGSTITFSGGSVNANNSCIVEVDVTTIDATVASIGVHTNVSDALVTDSGTGGIATANLTAVAVGYTAVINIDNFSFEAISLTDGGFDFSIPSWTQSGTTFTFNPATSQFTSEAPDGDNTAALNAGSLTQTTTTTIVDGAAYALVIDVGDRLDLTFGGYTLELLADGVAFASVTDPVLPAVNGTFATVLLDAVAGATEDGKTLGVRLIANGTQTNFDNVRLMSAPALPPVWVAKGPGPITGGQLDGITNRPVTGAVQSIAPHPSNADIIYAGATNGGIWVTSNATAASPSWTEQTADETSLSIGVVEFDPTDGTHQTLIAGVARRSSFLNPATGLSIGGSRTGVLHTTDGGVTWSSLSGMAGRNVVGAAARGATLVAAVEFADSFACTELGIWRSIDTGATWTRISGGAGTGLPFGVSETLEGDPSDPTRLYAPVQDLGNACSSGDGIYRSSDTGATWEKISDPATMDPLLDTGSIIPNVKISVSPADPDVVFVAIVDATSRLAGVFRTTNATAAAGSVTWTAMDIPGTNEVSGFVGIHPGGQGFLHLSLTADASDSNVAYIGGDRDPNPNFTGRLFRGDASLAPGSQWTLLTHGGTASNSSPHADSRDMEFDAAGNLIESSDGGVYKRTSPATTTGDWFSVNGDLQTIELHSSAYDTVSDNIFGGTQDNGGPEQTDFNSVSWVSVNSGDGGDVAVDITSIPGSSIRYSSSQLLLGFTRREFDAAGNLQSQASPSLTPLNPCPTPDDPLDEPCDDAVIAQFVNPIAVNRVDGTRLIIGASNAVYESFDRGDTISEVAEITANGVGSDTIAYGATGNADILYVGTSTGVFVRSAAPPAALASSAAYTGGSVNGLILDPDDPATAFVIDTAGAVFHTNDTGASWSDITGNLGSFAAGTLRSIEYMPRAAGDAIVVGTDRGVYIATAADGFAVWTDYSENLPNVPIFELDYDTTDDRLTAGTLGRGAFTRTTN